MKTKTIMLIVLFVLGGCSNNITSPDPVLHEKPLLTLSQKEKWNSLVGKWYGEQPIMEGGTRKWIVERAINGTYKTRFREYKNDGSFAESTEVGQWAVSGPVYMTMFRGHVKGDKIEYVNPSNPYNYDAYMIIELNTQLFKYKTYEYDAIYTTKKVNSDFSFSD